MTESRYVFLKTKERADGEIVALFADAEAVIDKDPETGKSEKLGLSGAISLRGAFAKANPTGVKGVITLTQSELEKRKKEFERDGRMEDAKVYQFALDRVNDRLKIKEGGFSFKETLTVPNGQTKMSMR